MVLIESQHNKQLKLYHSLEKRKYRDELGLVPLEGPRLIVDALLQGLTPEVVFLRAGLNKSDFPFLASLADAVVVSVEEKLFAKTAFTESPQGIFAVVHRPVNTLQDVFTLEPNLILVVDGVQDPGNLGTMLRSAAAAGAGGVVLLPGTVDATNPKALRASMGAYFVLPVVEATFSQFYVALQQRGTQLLIADAHATVSYEQFDWKTPVAVAIGNEGAGVSKELMAAATTTISIPMAAAVESLNAGIAMSVLFFEAARQRRLGRP